MIVLDLPIPPSVKRRVLSDKDRQAIGDYYRNTPPEEFCVARLASRLRWSEITISREAKRQGLTKLGRPKKQWERDLVGENNRYWIERKGHPRGMAGKRHTAETLAAVSHASKKTWATWKAFGTGQASPESRDQRSKRMAVFMASRPAEKVFTRARGGRRPDLGDTFFRSSWEANYARYLNLLVKLGAIKGWEYEPKTFWFEGVRRGTTSYRPDFCIKHKGDDRLEYIELKGWIVAKDRTKWRRMAKYHPTIKLTIVAPKEYAALKRKWASAIPAWEGSKKLAPKRAEAA
jgi:hypothetical protein